MGGLFGNRQESTILGTILEELYQPQPPTPIKTDNYTAAGTANKILRQSKSKPMDMRFYWIQDRVKQGQLIIYWKPGADNYGDYYTKHLICDHHKKVRYIYLQTE